MAVFMTTQVVWDATPAQLVESSQMNSASILNIKKGSLECFSVKIEALHFSKMSATTCK
jgi:hypothetical protein